MRYISTSSALFFGEAPPGAEVTVGSGSARPIPSSKSVPIDPTLVFGGKTDALFGGTTVTPVSVPITIEEGKKSWAGEFRFEPDQQRSATAQLFKAGRGGPVKAPSEGAGKATIWLVSPDTAPTVKMIGTARSFGDVGYVAIQTSTRTSKGCGSYRSSSGNTIYVTLNMYRETVEVYDRRTGKKLATKDLVPSSACPQATSARSGSASTSSGSFVPEKDIRDFIVGATRP